LHNRRASLSIVHTSVLLIVIAGVVVAAAPRGLTAVGFGMAVGGAAGNLLDRIRHGAIVDFVAAWRWPVFNLADTAMTVGILLVAVILL
jgi:signal peptidase II